VGLRGGHHGSPQRAALPQASHQEQGDYRNTEAEIGQGELRQEGNRPLTAAAQIAAHANNAVKARFH